MINTENKAGNTFKQKKIFNKIGFIFFYIGLFGVICLLAKLFTFQNDMVDADASISEALKYVYEVTSGCNSKLDAPLTAEIQNQWKNYPHRSDSIVKEVSITEPYSIKLVFDDKVLKRVPDLKDRSQFDVRDLRREACKAN